MQRRPFRLQLVDHFMVEPGNVAKMLCRLEHIARLVEVSAHAHRTVVAVGAMQTLREIIPQTARMRFVSGDSVQIHWRSCS